MKSNDDIPEDEMLLAEAIAAAAEFDLSHSVGARFRDANGNNLSSSDGASACCALGALEIAGIVDARPISIQNANLRDVWVGNDRSDWFSENQVDLGESLGWAFRCAVTQDEP